MHSRPRPITWKGGTTSLYKPGVLAGVTSGDRRLLRRLLLVQARADHCSRDAGGSLRDSRSSAGGCPCDQIEHEGTGVLCSPRFTLTHRGRTARRRVESAGEAREALFLCQHVARVRVRADCSPAGALPSGPIRGAPLLREAPLRPELQGPKPTGSACAVSAGDSPGERLHNDQRHHSRAWVSSGWRRRSAVGLSSSSQRHLLMCWPWSRRRPTLSAPVLGG